MSRKTRFELQTAILEKSIKIDSMEATVSGLCDLLYDAEDLILDMRDAGQDLPWGDKMLGRISAIVDKIRTSRANWVGSKEENND